MRKLLVVFVLVLAGGLMAVFTESAPSATRVKVGDNYFVRRSGVPTVTVSKGTTVRFNFSGADSPHTVTRISGPSFRSCSSTCSRTPRTRGTYRLYCTFHGKSDQSMKLVVK